MTFFTRVVNVIPIYVPQIFTIVTNDFRRLADLEQEYASTKEKFDREKKSLNDMHKDAEKVNMYFRLLFVDKGKPLTS